VLRYIVVIPMMLVGNYGCFCIFHRSRDNQLQSVTDTVVDQPALSIINVVAGLHND
jgi:hypothetical protein